MEMTLFDTDNIFTTISMASFATAFVGAFWLLFTSVLHFLLTGVRKLQKKPVKFSWWIGSRAVVAAIALVLLALLANETNVGPFLLFFVPFAVVCLPALLAILKLRFVDAANPQKRSTLGGLWLGAKTWILIFMLPGTIAMISSILPMVDTRYENGEAVNARAAYYYRVIEPTICADSVRSIFKRPANRSTDALDDIGEQMDLVSEFWMDTTVNSLTLGLLDSTGCNFRRLDYNRDDLRMVALGLAYNVILIFAVSAILYSILRRKKRESNLT